ncbi:MAG: Polysulfide reductase, NrfD [Chloroflexi bacterium]|jgi:molybdopterin-containing oxidoreductase family membrane subunit|nr:Polysulfide reductase, NrfD [Chloroflexota bacterium]
METTDRTPILGPGQTYASVNQRISDIPLTPLRKTRFGWIVGFLISFLLMMGLLWGVTILFIYGVGTWGINIPVGWGFAIINFVWWIGIGHAGTLISAILLLLKQDWRTSINRFAEAMTLFAVANALLFPILHLGRPWLFYYLMPYPNTLGLWPQFRSPLVWDVFAITTYALVSLLFWYMGLVPDLATLRDRAKNIWVKRIYGIMGLGWRSSVRHWNHYQSVYFLMAAIATPLVISVHSIVGMDFAYGVIPGWHSTIFPPYFVAGAVFSGFAMVLTLLIPLRSYFKFKDFITMRHLENMAKVMLAMGLIVAYGYITEIFMAFYSGDQFEIFNTLDRFGGFYAPLFWGLIACNVIIPQFLWIKSIRRNVLLLWIIAVLINVGMWLERFIIIVQSLSKDFLPSSWHIYLPTRWDVMILVGTIGLFLTLIFLFVRVLPAISIFEMRELVHHEAHGGPVAQAKAQDEAAD